MMTGTTFLEYSREEIRYFSNTSLIWYRDTPKSVRGDKNGPISKTNFYEELSSTNELI